MASTVSETPAAAKQTADHYVLPGQPIYAPSGVSAAINAGKGTYSRQPHGNANAPEIVSSAVGKLVKDGASLSVLGKEQVSVIPEAGSIVLGIVARLSRVQAVLNIVSVDGRPSQQDWQGIIRIGDIRQTDKDKIRIWDCFRPGDVVKASVISLGDVRSYYLSTARNDLGVIFAKSSDTGNRLKAVSWQEMEDTVTKAREPRKVAGPSA